MLHQLVQEGFLHHWCRNFVGIETSRLLSKNKQTPKKVAASNSRQGPTFSLVIHQAKLGQFPLKGSQTEQYHLPWKAAKRLSVFLEYSRHSGYQDGNLNFKRPKQRKNTYMCTINVYFVLIFKDTLSSHDCTLGGLLFESPVRALFSKGSEFGSPASISTVKSKMFQATLFNIKTGKETCLAFLYTSYEHLNSPTFVSFFFPCIPEQAQQLHWWLRGRPNLLHFGSSSPQWSGNTELPILAGPARIRTQLLEKESGAFGIYAIMTWTIYAAYMQLC